MADERKIIYIAGFGRSGSTIIDDILGQADGFFSAGEACDVWNQGCHEPCSCGKPLKDCAVWIAIFAAAYRCAPAEMDFSHPLQMARRVDRLRHMWWLLTAAGRHLADSSGTLSGYLDITRRLYDAMFSVSGARIIVDSSKAPSHAYLLQQLGIADIYIVHLVRDSRAVAFSWSFPKGKWPPRGLLRSCIEWNANNLLSEWLWSGQPRRYMRVAYEDFTRRPRAVIQRIVDFAGEQGTRLPFISDRTVELRTLHGYGGAPGRYTGRIDIVPDNKWRTNMSLTHRLAATAFTIPGLLRYRYPLSFAGIPALRINTPQSRAR